MATKEKTRTSCTYCGKPLGKKYGFSYGVPGIPRVYACDRFLCKLKRKVISKFKKMLNAYLKKY